MRVLPFLILFGCSIINDPPDPYDVGIRDGGADADASDAPGPDADAGMVENCDVTTDDEDLDTLFNCADVEDCEGMSCAESSGQCVCRNGRAVELDCTNGTDDDGDGTTDCGDFDCAGLRLDACCGGDATPGHWPTAICPTAGWTEGDGDANCTGAVLDEFMGSQPFGLVWGDCLSLALGATFEFDIVPDPAMDPTCDEDGRCPEHVKLLVAERNEPRVGNGLFFAELAVVAHASGLIEVLQGDAPAPEGSITVSGLTRIKIRFRPATATDGGAELRATVTYDPPDEDEMELWEGFVVSLDELISDGECISVPGFYLAFEGLGDAVRVERFAATQSECSNPNLFQPSLDAVLTPYDYMEAGTTSLELDPETRIDEGSRRDEPSWATQALSSPTLMSFGGDWLVAAEASNDQPANEPSFRVGYAIAYRENSTWNDELAGWTDGGSDRPWVGNQPPSCLDGSCTGEFSPEMPPYPSVRDPFLFEAGGVRVMAFAGEVDDEGEPARTERYGIYIANQSSLGDGEVPDTVTLAPGEVAGCDSLRDPVVVPRPGAETTDFWLFFTCYEGLASRGIWALPLSAAGEYAIIRAGDSIVEPRIVLAPGDLDFGRGGTLRSPEVVLDMFEDDSAFAMWFLVGQEVGLAIGAPKTPYTDRALTDDVPVFQLFEGNPVLVPSDRAFSRACSGCSIEGIAVTRTDDNTLRFLLARENDDTPARYDLLPLDQTWRNLASP